MTENTQLVIGILHYLLLYFTVKILREIMNNNVSIVLTRDYGDIYKIAGFYVL